MVVGQIHITDIAVLEAERDPPVAAHAQRPMSSEIASQRMQVQRMQVNVPRAGRHIQLLKDESDPADMSGRDTTAITLFVQTPKTAMSEVNDHQSGSLFDSLDLEGRLASLH